MKGNVIKRIWAWIMVACMLFTMVPAFAEEGVTETPEAVVVSESEAPAAEPEATPAAAPATAEETPEVTPESDVVADDEGSTDEAADEPTDETADALVTDESSEGDVAAEPSEGDDAVEPDETTAPEVTEAPEAEETEAPDETPDEAVVEADDQAAVITKDEHRYDRPDLDKEPTPDAIQDCRNPAPGNITWVSKWCSIHNTYEQAPYGKDGVYHRYTLDTKEADCEHGKRTGRFCSLCNKPDPDYPVQDDGQPLGHKFDMKLTYGAVGETTDPRVEAATCTKPGVDVLQCTRPFCSYGDWKKVDGKVVACAARKTVPTNPLNHPEEYRVREFMPATCELPSRYRIRCTLCNAQVGDYEVCTDERAQGAIGHNWTRVWTSEVTQNDDGTYNYRHYMICRNGDRCDFWNAVRGDARKYENCTVVSIAEDDPATCQHGVYKHVGCEVCGMENTEEHGRPDPNNHEWEYYTDKEKMILWTDSDATCGTTIQVYPRCHFSHDNDWVWGTPVYKKIEHIPVPVPPFVQQRCFEPVQQLMTCKRDGHCTGVGGAAQTWYDTLPATNKHNWSTDKPEVIAATCTEDEKVVLRCTNRYQNADGTWSACPETLVQETHTGTALGHDYYYADKTLNPWHILDENGRIGNISSINDLWATDENGLLLHPANGGNYYKKPTCTTDGWVIYECTRCADNVKDHQLRAPVAKLGHVAGQSVHRDADCVSPERDVVLCERCGGEIPELTVVTPNGNKATGHLYNNQNNGFNGWVPAGTNTALHDQWATATDQTDRESAQRHTRTCQRCGRQFTEPCTFVDKTLAADCKTPARRIRECSVCGQQLFVEFLGTEMDKLNHVYPTNPATHEKVPEVVQEATCTTPGTGSYRCVKCGVVFDTFQIPAGHQWADATPENTNLTQAQFNVLFARTEPTCSTPGAKWQICTRKYCTPAAGELTHTPYRDQPVSKKAIKKVTLPATGNHEWKQNAVRPATCVSNAYSGGYSCKICNKMDDTRPPQEIPDTKLGHQTPTTGATGIITKEPTCTTAGEMTYTCHRVVMWKVDTNNNGDLNDEVEQEFWSCSDNTATDGKHTWTEPIPATGHKWGVVAHYPADCINDERTEIHCTVCDAAKPNSITYVENGEKHTGHQWTGSWVYVEREADVGIDVHQRECTRCGLKTFACTFDEGVPTPANCTNPAGMTYTCNVCGHKKLVPTAGSVPNGQHVWKLVPYKDGVKDQSPTCSDVGVGQYVCELCGAKGNFKDMPAQHQWDEGAVTVEPGCTTPGLRTYTCKNDACPQRVGNKRATMTEEIPPTGHSWDRENYIVFVAPTCTEKGERVVICLLCGETKHEDLEALGHDWQVDPETSKPATCTEAGVNSEKCSRCGETRTEDVPALGHDWQNVAEVTKEATCTKPGVSSVKCSRCDETKTEDIPALGHTWERDDFDVNDPANQTEENGWVVDEPATTTAAGKGHFECTDPNCDAEEKPAKSADVVIPKHVHVYVPVRYKRSTEDRMRKIAHVTCSGCEETWDVEMGIDDPFDPSMIKE